jgi:hypothetical protein
LDLEISVYDRTPEGPIFFHMLDADGTLVRIELSDGVFDHPMSTLEGVAVRTVSPLALYQIRAGITMAGGFRTASSKGHHLAGGAAHPVLAPAWLPAVEHPAANGDLHSRSPGESRR